MQEKPAKKKMDDLTKAKLIYSGELGLFAILFLVLGILMLLKVYQSTPTRRTIFVWVTLFGGAFLIGDFLWTLLSKKHRKKASLLDKTLTLPSGITLIAYDLYTLISGVQNEDLHRYVVGSVFLYIALIYAFEALYHYAHPIPGLVDAAQEQPDEKPAEAKTAEEKPNEDKPSEVKPTEQPKEENK